MPSAILDLKTPVPLSQSPVWVNASPNWIAAGFPSPAEDHMVQRVDLMAQLIKHPQATFLLRVCCRRAKIDHLKREVPIQN